ncbi:MAG: DnaD domain protein [Clostridiaceae bacterium]
MGKITMTGIPQMSWIPSYIIEELMRDTPGSEFKVLIALYHAAQTTGSFSTLALAQICGCTEIDAISACEYWNNKAVLTILAMDSQGNLDLAFNHGRTLADDTGQSIEAKTPVPNQILESNDFKDLVGALEMSLGKPMSPSQLRFTLDLKETYRFDDEVIMLLYGYCAGKESVQYMEKVAASWQEKKIKNADEANALIRRFEDKWSNHRELFKYMGMDSSSIAKPQEEQLDRWFGDYGFDLVMIKHAAQRCINQLGKADLNYIEGILKRWKNNGIKTVAEAMKKDTLPKGSKQQQSGRKDITSFNNYDQRSYDYESLEKRLLGWRDEDE